MFSIYTYLQFVLCGCAECIACMRVYVYGVVRTICSKRFAAYNCLIINNFTPPVQVCSPERLGKCKWVSERIM